MLPKFLPDVPQIREDFADYLGEVQAFDAYVGEILKALDATGERDRTLVVLSGDHGAPGFPSGKCNLYDFGVAVSLMASMPGGSAGRVVDDFVSLMDLPPTFLEAAGVPIPEGVAGRSLMPQIRAPKSGLLDPSRDWVITGRERHVAGARDGNLPYPQRALRTKEYLYIRNFEPSRFPLGDAKTVTAEKAPTFDELATNTHLAYADMDASPTKAWLIENRHNPEVKPYYDFAFGTRPADELYDVKTDPDQMRNLADNPAYAGVKGAMHNRLMNLLNEAGDPRVAEKPPRFERPPFTDPVTPARAKKKDKP
jgi:uncharacterized sulfatase